MSAKDPVETKFVTLADYECFNAKDGTVSQPYNPEKKDHGEAPLWPCTVGHAILSSTAKSHAERDV